MQAIIYFLFVLLLAGCTQTSVESPPAPQAVRAVAVRQGPVLEGKKYLAEVVSDRSVRVLAQVPGTVSELSVAVGVVVGENDSLVHISAPDVAARISRVRAERERAERERDFACGLLNTDRVLAEAGDLSSFGLDRSEKSCAAAELVVKAAEAAEREADVTGTHVDERAPFEGEVLAQLVDVGQTVMPGTPLLQFGSSERRLRLRVPRSDLSAIAIGTRVQAGLVSGQVVEIGAQAQGQGRLVELLVKTDGVLRQPPGTTLTAIIVSAERASACSVPESALGEDDMGAYVLVVEGESLRRHDVQLGPRQEGWVAIEPQLPKETLVVSGAVSTLDPGRSVLAVTR